MTLLIGRKIGEVLRPCQQDQMPTTLLEMVGIKMCKVKLRLHAKWIAIGCNNYLCLNSILQNGHQHNSPQSQVQLEVTYEFFF